MESRTFEQAVDIMINFWVEKSFKTKMNQNNGDNSSGGGLAFILMNKLAMDGQSEITEQQIDKFKTHLKQNLMNNQNKGRWALELDVDYHPNQLLANSLEYAGISSNVVPCKTFTFIDEKDNFSVQGRYQYGGEWFKL